MVDEKRISRFAEISRRIFRRDRWQLELYTSEFGRGMSRNRDTLHPVVHFWKRSQGTRVERDTYAHPRPRRLSRLEYHGDTCVIARDAPFRMSKFASPLAPLAPLALTAPVSSDASDSGNPNRGGIDGVETRNEHTPSRVSVVRTRASKRVVTCSHWTDAESRRTRGHETKTTARRFVCFHCHSEIPLYVEAVHPILHHTRSKQRKLRHDTQTGEGRLHVQAGDHWKRTSVTSERQAETSAARGSQRRQA